MLIVSSADGRCGIEPLLPLGQKKGYSTARGFNEATNSLISRCVDGFTHRGGQTVNRMLRDGSSIEARVNFLRQTDATDDISVRVFIFDPQVQCYGSVNRQKMVTSCNNLANEMHASDEPTKFSTSSLIPDTFVTPYTEVDPG